MSSKVVGLGSQGTALVVKMSVLRARVAYVTSRYGQQGRYGARCGDGFCAEKANPGTSKIEMEIFAPLNYVIGSGKRNQIVSVDGRDLKVDMTFELTSNRLLIIEYDGAYWHQGHEDWDHRKSHLLQKNLRCPAMVIRIREDPLKVLCPGDVCVPPNSSGVTCARLVALHALHFIPRWLDDFELAQRTERWLACAAEPMQQDQVKCRICWRMTQLLRRKDVPIGAGVIAFRAEEELFSGSSSKYFEEIFHDTLC